MSDLFDILNEKQEQNKAQISNTYDILLDTLEDIKNIAFNDLTNGNISIIPFGDFLSLNVSITTAIP